MKYSKEQIKEMVKEELQKKVESEVLDWDSLFDLSQDVKKIEERIGPNTIVSMKGVKLLQALKDQFIFTNGPSVLSIYKKDIISILQYSFSTIELKTKWGFTYVLIF